MNALMQPFSMEGKTVLITAANRGIGAHIARLFSRAGARVVIAAHRLKQMEQLAADIQWEGGEVLMLALDLAKPSSIEAALNSLEARFGCVDVLINNAASMIDGSPCAYPDSTLKAFWHIARCVSRRMAEAGRAGCIINIAPRFGRHPDNPDLHNSELIQLSSNMAEQLARHQIRVNALAPECFDGHDWNDHSLEDLNGPLLLLASDAGICMTGAVLPIITAER